jgi:hypothetical protein
MLKTRVAHGYCSRLLAAETCISPSDFASTGQLAATLLAFTGR